MRWMRVERGGDARRRKDVEEEGEDLDGEGEGGGGGEGERRERKGVRVRVRLGVGGAIRNYCGTIDKRRLRGRTTEDSLRPSDFPSTRRLSFPLLLSFLWLPWTSALASCRSIRTRALPRLVNM